VKNVALLGIAAAVMLAPATARTWGWEVEEQNVDPGPFAEVLAPADAGAAGLEPAPSVEPDQAARAEAEGRVSIQEMP
jgi:hypothetical protein